MVTAIACNGLTKRYGDVAALEGLDLVVEPGQVFGFLGPNGAGKTTTIRLVLDLIRPTAGSVRVLGEDPRGNPGLRRRIGYLPGELALYESLTARQFLDFVATMRRLPDASFGYLLAERLGLRLDQRIRALSKGNKQKVGLVQALMHKPDLLVLDEPTSALDPLVQAQFQEIVNEAALEGRTVFLSSHVLDEVQELAHRVAIIRAGRLVTVQDVAALRAQARRWVELRFAGPFDLTDFANIAGVDRVEGDGARLRCRVAGDVDALIKAAARYHVLSVTSSTPDLDDVFLDFYREAADVHA